jgi:hypothetical protein
LADATREYLQTGNLLGDADIKGGFAAMGGEVAPPRRLQRRWASLVIDLSWQGVLCTMRHTTIAVYRAG